jgi:hypothetical protein
MGYVVMSLQIRFGIKELPTEETFMNLNGWPIIFGSHVLLVSECLHEFHCIRLPLHSLLIEMHLWCTPAMRTGNADRLNDSGIAKISKRFRGESLEDGCLQASEKTSLPVQK